MAHLGNPSVHVGEPVEHFADDEELEQGCMLLQSEPWLLGKLTTPASAIVTPHSIALFREDEDWIGFDYLNRFPKLYLRDRSGFDYASIGRYETAGVRFDLSTPLGMKNAFLRKMEAISEGNDAVVKSITETYERTHRLVFSAPPFGDPLLGVFKDGKILWTSRYGYPGSKP